MYVILCYACVCLLAGVCTSQVDGVGVTMKIPATGFALLFAYFVCVLTNSCGKNHV